MPAKKTKVTRSKTRSKRKAANPAKRTRLDQLRKTINDLKKKLEREVKAGKIEQRLKSEAQKAGAQLSSQVKKLRSEGRKLASGLKSALGNAGKRERARMEVLAKIAQVRAELANSGAELRRRTEELGKLAGESAHRAVEIIRGDKQDVEQAKDETESTLPHSATEQGQPVTDRDSGSKN